MLIVGMRFPVFSLYQLEAFQKKEQRLENRRCVSAYNPPKKNLYKLATNRCFHIHQFDIVKLQLKKIIKKVIFHQLMVIFHIF